MSSPSSSKIIITILITTFIGLLTNIAIISLPQTLISLSWLAWPLLLFSVLLLIYMELGYSRSIIRENSENLRPELVKRVMQGLLGLFLGIIVSTVAVLWSHIVAVPPPKGYPVIISDLWRIGEIRSIPQKLVLFMPIGGIIYGLTAFTLSNKTLFLHLTRLLFAYCFLGGVIGWHVGVIFGLIWEKTVGFDASGLYLEEMIEKNLYVYVAILGINCAILGSFLAMIVAFRNNDRVREG
ncbi:hypothetical protein [Candidatus Chloroploca asiatica]|uniref:hypothetical protein n=1 Tax=Candidatus Chloroploca asiatica TaxID=1506545 RepID=UPI0011448FE1|nr:hypothetical protein [Candidatus Chloroploca asiatica]